MLPQLLRVNVLRVVQTDSGPHYSAGSASKLIYLSVCVCFSNKRKEERKRERERESKKEIHSNVKRKRRGIRLTDRQTEGKKKKKKKTGEHLQTCSRQWNSIEFTFVFRGNCH